MYEGQISKLHWNNKTTPLEIIDEIIAMDISDLSFLLQPLDKPYWDKAAIVICSLGIERYIDYLPSMLEWLQDLNWPGALCIFNELKATEDERVIECIEYTVGKVIEIDDMEWLYFIKLLIDEIGAERFSFNDIHNKILEELN